MNRKRISLTTKYAGLLWLMLFCAALLHQQTQAQPGRDWMTSNGDAQRSSWIRADAKINKDSLSKPGFQFLWKIKLKNEPSQLNSLTSPATLERLIGYRGFRMLGFVGGSSNTIFTIDTDLGRMEWEKKLASAPAKTGTLACPGGMTASIVRPTTASIPAIMNSVGGGRMTPAKSGVGEPGAGAVTLANVRPTPIGPPPSPAAGARVNPANPPGGQFGAGPFLIYALSGDGLLHALHLSNGDPFEPPVRFLPPDANANGLIVVDQMAYAVTQGSCGGAANGLWALDTVTKQVVNWKGNIIGSAGAAFDSDGTVYVTTGSGGDSPNSLVALDQKTLNVKGSFSAGSTGFAASPVIFTWKGKTVIAAATRDGRLHLFDKANLSSPVASTNASVKATDFMPGALSSWQDAAGTRWILAATTDSQAADLGFAASNGAIAKGAIVAWRVVEQNGALSLQAGWASRDLISPLPPTIINGVVFAVSGGEFRTGDAKITAAQRAARSSRAVVSALDGMTGKELWNSGTTVTSFARGASIAGNMGQVYLTTHDGTIYAFGFPMEH
jgi:hypothetical protein